MLANIDPVVLGYGTLLAVLGLVGFLLYQRWSHNRAVSGKTGRTASMDV